MVCKNNYKNAQQHELNYQSIMSIIDSQQLHTWNFDLKKYITKLI